MELRTRRKGHFIVPFSDILEDFPNLPLYVLWLQVILYSFYKNICLYLIELWFAIYSAFSGQTIFERWTIALFNVAFTALPPVMIGLFDRPLPDQMMLSYPGLYESFQKRAFTITVSTL